MFCQEYCTMFCIVEPHLTLVIFDYNTMELRDFRRDVYLSEGEYSELLKDDNKVSFDVSM